MMKIFLTTLLLPICFLVSGQVISELDQNGNLLVDGQPFFPIGFYCEGLFFDEYPGIPGTLKNAGFNLLYTESAIGELEDYAPFMDECEAVGMKNILGLPYSFIDPEDFDFYVDTFKNRPSVIAWNIMDDANNFELSEIQLQKSNLLVRDTTRASSASWYNSISPFPEMVPSVELIGMQAYPWEDGSSNDLAFVDALWRETAVEAAANNKFAFATPQAFNWGVETYPPAAHLDCQSYIGLITGLKGIMYYTYKDYDNESTIDITQPEIFEVASRVAKEMLQTEWREAILFGVHNYVNINFYRYYATWEYEDFLYLIAVNANDQLSYAYDIPLPATVIGEATNFFPYRPDNLSIIDGRLQGTLSPYQVAIYRMDISEPLSVGQLDNLRGARQQNGVQITWSTTVELAIDRFDVEHSTDGYNFQKIGQVTASNASSYSHFHRNPIVGENYYRLKQINKDGTYTYSRFIVVAFQPSIAIYPNPASDFITIKFSERFTGEITLLDQLGQTVLSRKVDRDRQELYELGLNDLPAGIYILRIGKWVNHQHFKLIID